MTMRQPAADAPAHGAARVLAVLTSHGVLGPAGARGGRPTGFHLGELVEPWRALRAAGHRVDIASVRGGPPPMIGHAPDDPAQAAFLAHPAGGGLLTRTPAVRDVDAGAYRGVYFVGGHGTMWDFRDPALALLTRRVWENGGVVAAICHGPAALIDVRLAGGGHLVAGHAVTAFSDEAEAARGLAAVVPFSLQRALEERGARYRAAPDREPNVVVSGRLVTGQNPASAAGLGRAVVELLRPGAGTAPPAPVSAGRPPRP
ncbi:type 1 glutamine amidotransferase domain-containing protein [Streptomyces marincola]|uniref:type 1 glutamine amidotransferase domain-containing protein n=1 Tax=Streptomyces marincola TaxID=2878388 RepID=UPI001CF43542|nr:type 1 glutamine amidotransferase domain-containing protein [Streptomyces marincola]UCM91498.1 type 1 glutamine amidotransferase domain-containing protein [Streptomyces marincola]